ncbi:DUF6159 family protein [Arenimonas composti]|uniref:Glycerophosphoryl diester phosphodiesterase membrane domain-containing protein n=1 Tax=Arenimonas composti TR7-09 = DSM 18010 TaxID=1121013 RepID=A0A091B8V2_9GAMM|nr:DUF6159 family protein [Arenimonas composti]KFN49068.1 hypothetical protein P873_12300 [Arenimonas composti TR7-09 = DSM 18010]
MFDRIARSWQLVKASASVLRSDKELLVFPLVSSICALLVAATFVIPAMSMNLFDGQELRPAAYVLGFLFYLSQYFVIFFFNSALVGAAMIRLDGGDPTLGDGLRIATSKIVPILGYAAIAATVGMILRAIEERAGFIGRFVIGLLGTAWTLATFLVVPVLVSRDIGPVDAVKESVLLLKKTWGESIIGNAGIGLAFGLLTALAVLVVIALVVAAALLAGPTAAMVIGGIGVIGIALLATIQAALGGIYSAALYRYAVDGAAPVGFDGGALQSAFRPK